MSSRSEDSSSPRWIQVLVTGVVLLLAVGLFLLASSPETVVQQRELLSHPSVVGQVVLVLLGVACCSVGLPSARCRNRAGLTLVGLGLAVALGSHYLNRLGAAWSSLAFAQGWFGPQQRVTLFILASALSAVGLLLTAATARSIFASRRRSP